MSEHEPLWLERLDEFVELFREAFRRRDQSRWAAVYLQGLLLAGEAKTIGTMARRVTLPPDLLVDDVSQALQNFVNQSPWDERKLWRRHRQLQAGRHSATEGVLLLEDLAFRKQGRHSVGVQRQYSGVLGRKVSCQIAVMLSHVSTAGVCPLALRLYLPRSWLQSLSRLEAAGVPEEYRGPQTRGSVAVDLLDLARSEGWLTGTVLLGRGLGTEPAFREALAERQLQYLLEASEAQALLARESLWSLVAEEQPEKRYTLLTNAPVEGQETLLRQRELCQEQVAQTRPVLMDELGLDHFEGRSWRGFHHHACLVMLAYSFRQLHPEGLKASSSAML